MRWRGGCGTACGYAGSGVRGFGVTAHPRALAPSHLLLEQRLERLPRVIRRLRLARLVGGEVFHDLRLEERAFVAGLLAGDEGGVALEAVPLRRSVVVE